MREAGFSFSFFCNFDGGADLDVLVSNICFLCTIILESFHLLQRFSPFSSVGFGSSVSLLCITLYRLPLFLLFCFGFGMALTNTKDELYFFSAAKISYLFLLCIIEG